MTSTLSLSHPLSRPAVRCTAARRWQTLIRGRLALNALVRAEHVFLQGERHV